MSDTEEKTCPATTRFDAQTVTCRREADHAGVHLGPVDVEGGTELHQWSGPSGPDDDGPVSELPVWYSVLPLGKVVDLEPSARGIGWQNVLLDGAVLDDHEQIAALRVSFKATEDSPPRHVLVPWQAVAAVAWNGDQA